MRRRFAVSAFSWLASMLASVPCEAGFIGPGKYSGIAVFDRWDGCILNRGTYVMYVSEKVKEHLRPYTRRPVQIDAMDVYQPMNPGDALIREFEYLGPAPENSNRANPEAVRLGSSVEVPRDGGPVARIFVVNEGNTPAKPFSHDLAPTLLMKRDTPGTTPWFVSDGPSFALITRQNLYNIGPPLRGGKESLGGKSYAWRIRKDDALPRAGFTLGPKESRQIRVDPVLSDGEYDFLCGYGGFTLGGNYPASNLSAFDVKNGKTTIVRIKGREPQCRASGDSTR